jgi:multiple sugar transport system permease protein
MTHSSLRRATPWLLLALPLLLLFAFIILPYLLTFFFSTTSATLGHLADAKPVGTRNFESILSGRSPSFWSVVLVTTVFTVGTVAGSLGLGTAIALYAQTLSRGRRAVIIAICLIPWVVAGVVIGYTWKLIYDPQIGLANALLKTIGLPSISFLTGQWMAVTSLVVANVWATYGIILLIVSGALANLPPSIVLAGQADGASYARIVRRLILPSIRPAFLLAGLVALVSGLNVFDLTYVMTGGGPLYRTETLALEMYRQTTKLGNIGQGAAITVVLFSLSLVLAIAYVIIWRREARKWN